MEHQTPITRSGVALAFLGGVVVTLAVVAAWWALSNRHTGPSRSAMSGTEMSDMQGMERSGGEMAGMNMDQGAKETGRAAVTLTAARRQTIGVTTGVVEERPFATTIRAVGTVAYDEQRIKQVNLRVAGWVTKLTANFMGQYVRAGEPLLTIYSPELASTQAEYRLALRTRERVGVSLMEPIRTGANAQVQAARERLRLLNFSDTQIDALKETEPQSETTLVAPISGVVTKKNALQGAYVTPEMALYEIADLSTVWVYADVYEPDLAVVAVGQPADVTLAAYPNEVFHGRVVFIDPALSLETRTAKVRTEFANLDLRLKPGMYGDVRIQVKGKPVLAVPRTAILDSGTRSLAFLDQGDGRYQPREVKTGRTFEGYTEVVDGLSAGDRVVTSATFLIDSESQLMAATNMMGALGMGGIRMEQAQMGEMEMGGMPDMKGMERMPGMKMGAAEPTPSTQTVDGLTLTLATTPEPAKKGENVVRLTVRVNGAPVTDATVSVAYTMAMPGMEVETVPAIHIQAGIYEATLDLAMKGGWTIDAIVTRPNAKPAQARFTVQAGK